MDRGERRYRDRRHGARVRRVRLSTYNGVSWVGDNTTWFYRKAKAIGCGCRRKHKGNPKIIRGFCHGVTGYHPSTRQRMEGKKLVRAWSGWGGEWCDFEEKIRRRERR